MLANGIDGLLLQVTNLPGVYESAILPSALSTLACEIDTHQLSHTFGLWGKRQKPSCQAY